MGLKRLIGLILQLVWIQHSLSDQQHLSHQCGFTRYPETCIQTLSGLGLLHHQNVDLLLPALVENLRNETALALPTSNPSSSLDSETLMSSRHGYASSIGYCTELMSMSLKRLGDSLSALKDSPRKRKQDIQTWLSAVLTFQSTCKDELNGKRGDIVGNILSKTCYISQLASNTLALVNRILGEPNSTTTGEFPLWIAAKNRKLLQTNSIKANAVVAKDGSGNYRTVSDAIKAASGGRFVIYIKPGVYKEKIQTSKYGITLIGAGKYSTIIAYGDSAQSGSSMPATATFAITGDGFIARDIGFQNTAGPNGGQALAMDIASDRSVFYRCSIAGYQDTLFAHALRQFYRECDIYGTVDFIFGNAAAVLQNCNVILRRPRSGGYNVILANGREDPGQATGFSLQRCRIMPGSDFAPVKHSVASYLGRPWKKYARSVIMQSTIDDAISPRGWIEWSGGFALSTLYFAEYSNSGPGSSTSNRVRWPGYHVIGSGEADKFTVARFIGGTSWLPSAGINFNSGLA